MSYLGIDLSASPNRPSACALLDGDARLLHMASFKTFEELQGLLGTHKPSLIAIDAPLSLPLGLDCLEEDHPCASSLDQKGRTSEQELARMHIGCFFTTKRSIIKGLIYRGLKMREDLVQMGYMVIEVYPYATKVILFGDKIPPKNSARGLAFLKQKLDGLVEGIDPHLDGLNHDGSPATRSWLPTLPASIKGTGPIPLAALMRGTSWCPSCLPGSPTSRLSLKPALCTSWLHTRGNILASLPDAALQWCTLSP